MYALLQKILWVGVVSNMKRYCVFQDILRYPPISHYSVAKDNIMKKIKPEDFLSSRQGAHERRKGIVGMKTITPQEFLDIVDKKWNFVTKDQDGTIKLWEATPFTEDKIWWGQLVDGVFRKISSEFFYGHFLININIEWPSDDWRECIAEREPDLGDMIGKIVVTGDYRIGKLREYEAGKEFPYIVDLLGSGITFRCKSVHPLTKEEKELFA